MWKPEHRRARDRRGLRYPSDLTDAEWALITPSYRSALNCFTAILPEQRLHTRPPRRRTGVGGGDGTRLNGGFRLHVRSSASIPTDCRYHTVMTDETTAGSEAPPARRLP